jgi:TolA-binding protein
MPKGLKHSGWKVVSLAALAGAWAVAATAQPAPSEAQSPSAAPVPVAADAAAPVATQVVAPAAEAPIAVSIPTPVPVIFPPSPPQLLQTPETLSARTLVRLDQLTRELAETIGRVEALEASNAALKSENQRLVTLMDAARATPPVAEKVADAAPDVAAMATPSQAVATAPTEAALFLAPVPPPIAPTIMLNNAQVALQSGNYASAEANLTQLIWVYPSSPEASEGRWLLGEARYVQSAWGTAAQAYVDYLKVTPQGPRAAEALLRLAGAFRQLGDNRQRCLALGEFKRRAPRPDPTLKARADSEIARMTCPTT